MFLSLSLDHNVSLSPNCEIVSQRNGETSYAIRTGNNMLPTLHPEETIQRVITIKRIRSARKTRHDPCLVIGFKRAIARLVFDT